MDLDTLNGPQRNAVTAGDGAHLVIAGAGTGKTRTLVHRVAWLLMQRPDVAPWEIVLLTFTRRAASEMLERAAALVGPRATQVKGGTFHSFAAVTLRRHAEKLGYSRRFTILDSSDAEGVMGLVRNEVNPGTAGKRFPNKRTLCKIASAVINTRRDLALVLEEDHPKHVDFEDDIRRCLVGYAERKKRQDVMDFDDLLVRLAELLREHPEARQQVAGRCKHVLVDEYQDTNRLQAEIACYLASVHGNLMVVGDEAQSIYAFRGAHVENILQFPKLFPACVTTTLEQNYRSSSFILDLANGVLGTFEEGFEKELWSDIDDEQMPFHVEVSDAEAEARHVVDTVLEARENGIALERQAVLFRSAFHANLLESMLNAANIPYRKFGGLKFLEAAHIKDVIALLRILGNPKDVLSWFRALQWFEGIGAKTAQRVAEAAAEAGATTIDVVPFQGRRYATGVKTLNQWLEEAVREPDLVAMVTSLVRSYRSKLHDLYDDAHRRTHDLDTLPQIAARYPDLETFLEEMALDPPSSAEADPQEEFDEPPLTLSTVHSAKGLEWHSVHVLHLGDGNFPSGYALESASAMDEERRLFYVAVTRAKRRLYLYEPRFLAARWGAASGPGCALIEEMDLYEDLVEVIRPAGRRPVDSDAFALEERLERFRDFFGS